MNTKAFTFSEKKRIKSHCNYYSIKLDTSIGGIIIIGNSKIVKYDNDTFELNGEKVYTDFNSLMKDIKEI